MFWRNFYYLFYVLGIFNDRNIFQKWWWFFFGFFNFLFVQESKLLRLSIYILDLREFGVGCVCLFLGDYLSLCFVFFFLDIFFIIIVFLLIFGIIQKMFQVVYESFKIFEREQQKFYIFNGKFEVFLDNLLFMCRFCRY